MTSKCVHQPWTHRGKEHLCAHTPCRTHSFSDTFSLRGVPTSRTRMAQGVCSAHIMSHNLTLYISCIIHRPCCSTRSYRHFVLVCTFLVELFQRGSCALPHKQFGYVADSTHSTGHEPKEFDKITSADGDTTPINDPNYDNISDISKIKRENIGFFGVSTMLEASVSHVSNGESKDSMHPETVAGERERERRKRRFCDQCCRVDVKEKSTEQYQESFSSDSQRIKI